MSLTKPMLGLAVGGTLGLLDGLSGFLETSLAPVMGSVITFSLLKGLLAGIATGYVSQRVHFHAARNTRRNPDCGNIESSRNFASGMALFWDILLPGMLLGVIVGFATQRFGRAKESAIAAQ